jgi:hypothetical protein
MDWVIKCENSSKIKINITRQFDDELFEYLEQMWGNGWNLYLFGWWECLLKNGMDVQNVEIGVK